ncbi:Leucine-rich repeat protein kinase family protein [Rhynchospora pubera]|uniref:non-specific serine/threonine protein kinase n=1 Tax=Rhynchospora pubera TaxID=906938 RepID=A0AAV8HLD3_9POAL|nr:Leucine-rich repeat protein kinase family protein [Rhynchospora pubera]
MRSALACLGFKQRTENEERMFVPWHSGTKGDGTAPQVNGTRYFSFEELKRCTANFSKNNEIGVGDYNEVYKGHCTNGIVVAIKRARKLPFFDTKAFQSEIEVLTRVHHKNIVSLVGFCFEQSEQLLVYEYVSNRTLRDNLDGEGDMCLDWTKRLQIALDSARGLAYLHELANPLIIHGNVKSSNILLDENLHPKLTDFCASKLVYEKQNGHVSSQVRGTLGHVASGISGTLVSIRISC